MCVRMCSHGGGLRSGSNCPSPAEPDNGVIGREQRVQEGTRPRWEPGENIYDPNEVLDSGDGTGAEIKDFLDEEVGQEFVPEQWHRLLVPASFVDEDGILRLQILKL